MQSDGVVKSVNDFVINLIEPLVIVVAEGMLIGVQNGQSAEDSASSTVSGSIWAMLGGTVIAILAFAPIGLSPDNTGEYCRSLLQVVGISMILSWLLAITATPVIGHLMLKPAAQSGDPYNNFLFRAYRAFLEGCLHRRLMTIAVVVIIFAFSLITLITSVEKVFFPSSTAMYFVADLWNREGTSINVQRDLTEQLAERLMKRPA